MLIKYIHPRNIIQKTNTIDDASINNGITHRIMFPSNSNFTFGHKKSSKLQKYSDFLTL